MFGKFVTSASYTARFGRDEALVKDFAELYNTESFRHAMRVRGVVRRGASARWEVQVEDGSWVGYEDEASLAIESAFERRLPRLELRLGPRGWQYVIDLVKQEQLNPKTKKSRPIRRAELATSPVSPEGAAAGAASLKRGGHQAHSCSSLLYSISLYLLYDTQSM